MEKAFWIARKRASLKLAQDAAGADAWLARYELAGHYSVKAASIATAATDLADALSRPAHSAGGEIR